TDGGNAHCSCGENVGWSLRAENWAATFFPPSGHENAMTSAILSFFLAIAVTSGDANNPPRSVYLWKGPARAMKIIRFESNAKAFETVFREPQGLGEFHPEFGS